MREFMSDEDCADCLCRVCARNSCNDSYNPLVEYETCECNCTYGSWIFETEDDCSDFVSDIDDLLQGG